MPPLPLTGIDITFALSDDPCMVEIQAAVTCTGVTGVEMEAPDGFGRGINHLRYVQSRSEGHAHHQYPPAGKMRRQKRRLQNKGVSHLATVVSVNISEQKGDHQDWHRQISLLAEESVDTMRDACPIPWTREYLPRTSTPRA